MKNIILFLILFFLIYNQNSFSQIKNELSHEELKQELKKLEEKIDETKNKIKEVKDVQFLPDLYFLLADFYSKQSRFLYTIKSLEHPNSETSDFSIELKPKWLAIEIYNRILEKFPQSGRLDEALFLKAHELRELSQFKEMVQVLEELGSKYPKSSHWAESQLILGNYLLDNEKKVELALEVYNKIVAQNVTVFTPLAHEKRGWCYINLHQFEKSLLAFESVFKSYQDSENHFFTEELNKKNVRRDALIAMVWPYSEVSLKRLEKLGENRKEIIEYFYHLAPDLVSYKMALSKLGKRLNLKHRFIDATKVYFELLRTSTNIVDRIDIIERLYVNMKNTQNRWPLRGFINQIGATLSRIRFDDQYQKYRKKIEHDFEIFARDIATRSHERAKSTNKYEDFEWAMNDYETYNYYFETSLNIKKMKLNLGQVYNSMGLFVLSGKIYENALKSTNLSSDELRETYESSLKGFILGLKNSIKLDKVELKEARSGLRDLGNEYISKYPRHPIIPTIKFNIAQSYYDERVFDLAANQLKLFIKSYPTNKNTNLAVDLLLDIHHQTEDYEKLISDSREILNNRNILDSHLKENVKQIIQQVELKKIQFTDNNKETYSENLLQLAKKYKGSEIGEKALYEAFISYKSNNDIRLFEVGERLVAQHNSSSYTKDVLLSLGQLSLMTANFEKAALYFEIFGRKHKNDPQATQLLKTAADLRERMGNYRLAVEDYREIKDWDSVAKMDYKSRNWTALLRSAKNVEGVRGHYLSGIALYHLKGFSAAKDSFENAAKTNSEDDKDKEFKAKSSFLLAIGILKSFENIKMVEGNEKSAVSRKIELLNKMSIDLSNVAASEKGELVIGALYGLGRIHNDFANFIEQSPIPKNLNSTLQNEFKKQIQIQVLKYKKNGNQYFTQCLNLATKYTIFSEYLKGCQTGNNTKLSFFEEPSPTFNNNEPKEIENYRKKLLIQSKDIESLKKIISSYINSKNYSLANLVIDRALEVQPDNPELLAQKGVCETLISGANQGKKFFDLSLKNDKNNQTALWSLVELYQEYGLKSKLSQVLPRAKKSAKSRLPASLKAISPSTKD